MYQQAPLLSSPPMHHQQQQQHVVYVTSSPGMVPEEDSTCAQVACIFSWIPIVGWVNFCSNSSAPEYSKRRKLAQISCAIASVVFLINVIVLSVEA